MLSYKSFSTRDQDGIAFLGKGVHRSVTPGAIPVSSKDCVLGRVSSAKGDSTPLYDLYLLSRGTRMSCCRFWCSNFWLQRTTFRLEARLKFRERFFGSNKSDRVPTLQAGGAGRRQGGNAAAMKTWALGKAVLGFLCLAPLAYSTTHPQPANP
jgi:hypothetical protein